MAKKNYSLNSNEKVMSQIIAWKTPVFHQKSECYVSFQAYDPLSGRLKTKKIMLGHIKGKTNQRKYAEDLIKRLTEQLSSGWNPWIEAVQPLEYALWDDVISKYKDYLVKLCNEHSLREESYVDYSSRVHILEQWKVAKRIPLTYVYQWDRQTITKFLDYVFIERNNTITTRNNYLTWLKSFTSYLVRALKKMPILGKINKNAVSFYACEQFSDIQIPSLF